MAMADDLPDASGDDDSPDVSDEVFSEAASSAFELWGEGKKDEAISSLKGAIEACVADYMADE